MIIYLAGRGGGPEEEDYLIRLMREKDIGYDRMATMYYRSHADQILRQSKEERNYGKRRTRKNRNK